MSSLAAFKCDRCGKSAWSEEHPGALPAGWNSLTPVEPVSVGRRLDLCSNCWADWTAFMAGGGS